MTDGAGRTHPTDGPHTLVGAGVVLDRPQPGDVDAITAACRDPEAVRFLNVPQPYGRTDAEAFVTAVPLGWADGSDRALAIRESPGGPILGTLGLRGAMPVVELGIHVFPEARGRGLATRALELAIDWAIANGATRFEWECLADNVASARLAERLGFTFVRSGPSSSTLQHAGRPARFAVRDVPARRAPGVPARPRMD